MLCSCSKVEKHKTAVKQAVLSVHTKQASSTQRSGEKKAVKDAPAQPSSSGSPHTARRDVPVVEQKEVTVAHSSLVAPLVTSAQPTRPAVRLTQTAAQHHPKTESAVAAAPMADALLHTQQRQQQQQHQQTLPVGMEAEVGEE